ncbi:MAG: kelch repeat-containing protein, partial [Candidatus Binatia bacterium]
MPQKSNSTPMHQSTSFQSLRLSLLAFTAVACLAIALPGNASATCNLPPAGDADCDGMADGLDPCPADALNRCSGAVASCATAPPGAQDCDAGEQLRLDIGLTGPPNPPTPLGACDATTWRPDFGLGSIGGNPGLVKDAPISTYLGCTADDDTRAIIGSHKSSSGDPTLSRSYPIANGSYIVNMLFAEAFGGACAGGARVMDIAVEGVSVYTSFDPFIEAFTLNGGLDGGCGSLVVRSAVTTVSDNTLDLIFTDVVGDAMVSALEVIEYSPECAIDVDCDDANVCTIDTCNAIGACEYDGAGVVDSDGDGVCDDADNCINTQNADQADNDADGNGNACDVCPNDGLDDADGDGDCADVDNCPFSANGGQEDADGDGCGDICDVCPVASGSAENTCLGTGYWETRPEPSTDRSEAGMALVGTKIYIMGGETASSGRTVDAYNIQSQSWTSAPLMPGYGVENYGRNHIQPVVIGSKIYVAGGFTVTTRAGIEELIVLDTNNLGAGWQQLTPMPSGRGSMACAADGVQIFCAGGADDASTALSLGGLRIYNTLTDVWSTGASMPRDRDSTFAQMIDGKMYVIGGRDSTPSNPVTATDIYNVATNSWSTGASLPTPRSGGGTVAVGKRILMMGGELPEGGGGPVGGTFDTVEEYNTLTNSWRTLGSMPTARKAFNAVYSRAEDGVHPVVHTITGSPIQGFSSSNIHEVFRYDTCFSDLECDDLNVCTDDVCTDGVCGTVNNIEPCDDGLFCNGADTCLDGACAAGIVSPCDDLVGCTDDVCDDVLDTCTSTPNVLLCDDAVGCTDDVCDAVLDCISTPNALNCDDTLFCNGAEVCDALLDCQAGTAPVIDDLVGCTDDSCDELNDIIVNTVNDGNCDDTLFCNGLETCDAAADCQAGTAPVADDGIGCTDDSCDELNDIIVNTVNDGNCDDGLFCNGSETCDAAADCQAGTAPVADDGVGCT